MIMPDTNEKKWVDFFQCANKQSISTICTVQVSELYFSDERVQELDRIKFILAFVAGDFLLVG